MRLVGFMLSTLVHYNSPPYYTSAISKPYPMMPFLDIKDTLLQIRRFLLKWLIPEFVWPKFVNIGGAELALRGAPYSFGIKLLLSRNPDDYEKAERYFLSQISESDHVLEYGGSIGVLTALICEKAYKGRVVSVEASKRLLEYSKTWLSRYQNLHLIEAVAFPVYRPFPVSYDFDDNRGSLGGQVDYEICANEESNKSVFFIRDCEQLDGFYPTVLVCDVEGTERILLEKEMELPNSISKIFIELHPCIYGEQVADQIMKKIVQQGFELKESKEAVYFFRKQLGVESSYR